MNKMKPDMIENNLSSSDMSLLIVEDEKNLRNQLAKAMERRGCIVTTAESVAEG